MKSFSDFINLDEMGTLGTDPREPLRKYHDNAILRTSSKSRKRKDIAKVNTGTMTKDQFHAKWNSAGK